MRFTSIFALSAAVAGVLATDEITGTTTLTSTLTKTKTITECNPDVPDCPLHSTTSTSTSCTAGTV